MTKQQQLAESKETTGALREVLQSILRKEPEGSPYVVLAYLLLRRRKSRLAGPPKFKENTILTRKLV